MGLTFFKGHEGGRVCLVEIHCIMLMYVVFLTHEQYMLQPSPFPAPPAVSHKTCHWFWQLLITQLFSNTSCSANHAILSL